MVSSGVALTKDAPVKPVLRRHGRCSSSMLKKGGEDLRAFGCAAAAKEQKVVGQYRQIVPNTQYSHLSTYINQKQYRETETILFQDRNFKYIFFQNKTTA